MLYALFEPNEELSAIFHIAGVVIWLVAAFAGGRISGRVSGVGGLVALGLAVFFFPNMWVEADAAF